MSFTRRELAHSGDSRLEYEDMSDVEREESGNSTRAPSATPGGDPEKSSHAVPPRFGAGFWDKDASTTKARQLYFKVLFMGNLLTIIVIFSVLPIYWGALWKLNDHIHNLHGFVVVSLIFRHC